MTPNRLTVRSEVLDEDRDVWTVPPFVESSVAGVLVLLDGEFYRERMPTLDIIERMQRANEAPAFWTVFVDQGERERRWRDTMCSVTFGRFLAGELPETIAAETGPTAAWSIGGLSLSGLQATYTAMLHPERYQRVFAQSPSFWWSDESVWVGIDRLDQLDVYVSCGLDETAVDVDHGHGLIQRVSQLGGCRAFCRALRDRGASVEYTEIPGGHDFETWTRDLPACLSLLRPGESRTG